MALSARHELKYYISRSQYEILSRLLKKVLAPDPHADENNEYHIRSLYFDSIFNDAMVDKVAGVADRNKYRIRIYNCSDHIIRMECKSKVQNYISKRGAAISRDLCEQLIACDPSGLENTESGLLRDVYREMRVSPDAPGGGGGLCAGSVYAPEEVRITFDKQPAQGWGRQIFLTGSCPSTRRWRTLIR